MLADGRAAAVCLHCEVSGTMGGAHPLLGDYLWGDLGLEATSGLFVLRSGLMLVRNYLDLNFDTET